MRGCVDPQGEVYHTFILDDLVPANHPLRQVTTRADRILAEMSARFTRAYGRTGRRSAQRRVRTRGYAINQRIRKRVEKIIGWLKVAGGPARARFVGRGKIKQQAEVTAAAYNLLRLARLAPAV